MSRFWSFALRRFYRFLVLVDPLVRTWYRPFGLGNTIDLVVPGRRSGKPRRVLLGLQRAAPPPRRAPRASSAAGARPPPPGGGGFFSPARSRRVPLDRGTPHDARP